MNDPTPPTEQQLNEIRARAQAATSGPWGVYQYGGDSLIEIAADLEETGSGYRARRTVCRFDEEPLDNDPTHREWTAEEDWAQVQADAQFIAHAPEDVDTLLSEVRRLRAELDRRTEDVAFLERATLPELRRTVEHHKDGKQRWRTRAEKAEARVAELERPAVEAKRNEIRQSYTDLIAQAEQDRDFEGKFDVQCRLREREEQWKVEDAARPTAVPPQPKEA